MGTIALSPHVYKYRNINLYLFHHPFHVVRSRGPDWVFRSVTDGVLDDQVYVTPAGGIKQVFGQSRPYNTLRTKKVKVPAPYQSPVPIASICEVTALSKEVQHEWPNMLPQALLQ